jgi:hypothetical protein
VRAVIREAASMTLREAELARAVRARRSHTKKVQRKSLKQPLSLQQPHLLDEQVLSFRQWCQLNGIGERTGRRLLATGKGPVVTKLSDHRIGIRVVDNRRWQESRARS